ncbi:polyprenyl synthetase family protein [Streptomyces sp. H27-G5]|uniref:polyprenyl synthetase family protein n=1 Tax=Streptomyces sp. H27-G5 TaxID=2996698 RepID=UPI00226F968A|nr:polyprenyl synthetase family protein [Streptomyces sp. H27-G5]MCY0924045.1 polyprenyl synthetase family protein [Streptomyces sp. H27-G5]
MQQPAQAATAGHALTDTDTGLRQSAGPLAQALDRLYTADADAGMTRRLCGPIDLRNLSADALDGMGRRLHHALVMPVRYLVEAGGARWRPQLLLAVIDLLGGDSTRYLPLAAAMEVMHTGSLMVDDVQDQATLRRGRTPAHAVFGPASTINAGTAPPTSPSTTPCAPRCPTTRICAARSTRSVWARCAPPTPDRAWTCKATEQRWTAP